MPRVKQGLKSLAESSPNLNNNAVNVLIADTNLGYATLSYTLAQRIRTNTVLTASQKTDLKNTINNNCLLYTSPSPRDRQKSRMPSSA